MEDVFVIEHIKELCKERGWTQYRLALESGIPYSSLNTMLNRRHIPSMANLIKICKGFDIKMSEFFMGIETRNSGDKNNQDDEFTRLWHLLDNDTKQFLLGYMYGITRQEFPPADISQEDGNEI